MTAAPRRVALEPDAYDGSASGECVVATLGCVAQRWVALRESRSEPVAMVEGGGPPKGVMHVRPIHTSLALTEMIGKESQSWGLGFSGVIEATDDVWLSSFGTAADPMAAILVPAIKRITAVRVAEGASCSPNTVRALLDGKHPTSPGVLDRIVRVAVAYARAALGRGTGPKVRATGVSSRMQYALIELWLRTEKDGRVCEWGPCLNRVAKRRRYCSGTCQKRAKRKEDRVRLAAIGTVRCRRAHCRTVRFGDATGPCPGCNDEPLATVAGCCRNCRTTFYGEVPVPCPFCEEAAG
jgi:hypothetical protein